MAGDAPALQFVILSEVACQAVALCEGLEEFLINGIRKEHAALRR
jgi:hypothetical protein